MENNAYQHYKEQSINTMTQGELLLLLYDELVKRLIGCDLALTEGNFVLLDESVDRCTNILRYLDETLDRRFPISTELHRLYEYFTYELGRVKIGRNKTELEKIRPMITELRDCFRAAEKKSSEGQ
ncbi:MAG: flagellar protein FliS [Clostridia bacterium]|nr:flagellar protein FliS [Clostridia bacterium]